MSDPSKCPHCQEPMKPLFTGFFCPKDCDKPHLRLKALDKEIAEAHKTMAIPRILMPATQPNANVWNMGGWLPYTGPVAPAVVLADDECRDFFCNAKGKVTHSVTVTQPSGIVDRFVYYACVACAKTWNVKSPIPSPSLTGATIP